MHAKIIPGKLICKYTHLWKLKKKKNPEKIKKHPQFTNKKKSSKPKCLPRKGNTNNHLSRNKINS